jgi:hypothetical protein
MCEAQNFKTLSSYEKRWAIAHPFAALKVRTIYKKCWPLYEFMSKKNELDRFSSGGKLDAYRHVFFMAAFSQKINPKKIRKLGKAHEKGNYKAFLKNKKENDETPDSLSCVMDLLNNELGIKTGRANKRINLSDLSALSVSEIKKGNAIYFKRNAKGEYITCSDEFIDLKNYVSKWFIPKCLISSDK